MGDIGGVELRIPGTLPALAALAFGAPSGRPVLALHGWLDNGASFAGLAPLLPGMHVVAVDLPGHGRSGHRSADGSYHFVDWVPEVFRIADGLGWQRFSILGHSMGAAIATLAASAAPQRIAALALIEGLVPQPGDAASGPDRLAAYLLASSKRRSLPVYATERAALDARLAAGEFRDPERMLGIVRRGLREVPGGWTWSSDPRLKLPSPFRFDPAQIAAFLPRVTPPTLVVRAAAGMLSGSAAVEAALSLLPALEQITLPGFHHLHIDDPEPVAAVVRSFFERHPA